MKLACPNELQQASRVSVCGMCAEEAPSALLSHLALLFKVLLCAISGTMHCDTIVDLFNYCTLSVNPINLILLVKFHCVYLQYNILN